MCKRFYRIIAAMTLAQPSKNLIQLLLVWFALTLGSAVASPLIAPQSMELICSGAGAIQRVLKSGDESAAAGAEPHSLDCSLCVNLGAPPPLLSLDSPAPVALAHAMRSIPAARMAALTSAPPPSRGPPSAH